MNLRQVTSRRTGRITDCAKLCAVDFDLHAVPLAHCEHGAIAARHARLPLVARDGAARLACFNERVERVNALEVGIHCATVVAAGEAAMTPLDIIYLLRCAKRRQFDDEVNCPTKDFAAAFPSVYS